MNPLPGYERGELLRRDDEQTLSRAVADDGTRVLVLELVAERPQLSSLARLDHEYALRAELAGESTVRPLALLHAEGRKTLVLEDAGEPLKPAPGQPMEPARFLPVAIALAHVLGKVHERGLIHKDIKPANVLIDSDGAVRLTGFGIAIRAPREHQAAEPAAALAGTLAYMAPEQTGRMNRAVDSRSDLYSLGVTFYQLLTGTLPFSASDSLEWIHCHIARQAPSPAERQPAVPAQLSSLVMKLLAKSPEDRYQTAAGLALDLQRCLQDWRDSGHISSFPLGSDDASGRLMISGRLYGREPEQRVLTEAVVRVANGGHSELILIAGYAGIGKSVLAGELRKTMVEPRGIFLSAKFDQFKRDIPYATLMLAFQAFVRQILGQSEAEVAIWRERILHAVGINGQLLIDLIPELEFIIGKQAPATKIASSEAQHRFVEVFCQFVGAFASREHPLVLFLDDLQWQDAGSLNLLEHLMVRHDIRCLLVIGTYRDNEMDPTHPLISSLADLRRHGGIVHEIQLAAITLEDMQQLVADILHCDSTHALPLAQLLHAKTAGNPLFALQFLTALHEEGSLKFDAQARLWCWDSGRIAARSFTDNVGELMGAKLQRLPQTTLDILTHLACFGDTAPVATLARVAECSVAEIETNLEQALHAGFVLRVGHNIKFSHGRIQEAAYAMIPPVARMSMHLRVGRLLISEMAPAEIDATVFDLVHHFNLGSSLITDAEEKDQLCQLNRMAGRKARASAAYRSARGYLEQAIALLPAMAWNTRYEEIFALYLECAECEFVIGNLTEADELLELILGYARSHQDHARVARLRIRMYYVQARGTDCLNVGLDTLRLFDVNFPESDEELLATVDSERRQLIQKMNGRSVADLIDLPVATDPDVKTIIGILADLLTAAYSTRPAIALPILVKALNLSLDHGNIEESCAIYSNYGIALAGLFSDIPTGFEYSDMSLRLNTKFNDAKLRGRLMFIHAYAFHGTRNSLVSCAPLLQQAFAACQQVGNVGFAGASANAATWMTWEAGKPLGEVLQLAAEYKEFTLQPRVFTAYGVIPMLVSLTAQLQGTTSDGDAGFGEAIRRGGSSYALGHHHITQQVANFSFARYEEALASAGLAEAMFSSLRALAPMATHHFYHALTLAALFQQGDAGRREEFRSALAVQARELEKWAVSCPHNYLNRHALVLAEIARIEDRDMDAMRLYEQAIRSARDNGFIQNEALANELAADFYLERGFDKIACAYMADARYGYLRWEAHAKVKQLDLRFSALRVDVPAPGALPGSDSGGNLDVMTVVRASQAVSGEIQLDRLLEKLMRLLIENAGAEKGLLLLQQQDQLLIQARAQADSIQVLQAIPAEGSADLSLGLIGYVKRTRERVVLADAAIDIRFNNDPYIIEKRSKSMLCIPLLKQAEMVGMLYLENNLAAGVFTPERTELLEILSTQIAISLENATLYNQLEQKVEARTQALSQTNAELSHTLGALQQTQNQLVESEKLAALGGLVAGIAHEINTPVGVGVTAASTLARRTRDFYAAFQAGEITRKSDFAKYLDVCVESSEILLNNLARAADLIQRFKRIAVDQSSEERRSIEVKDYIKDVVVSLHPKLKNRKIEIDIHGDDDTVLDSFPGALAQVLSNLLMNSLFHAYPGDAEGHISISVEKQDTRVVIVYADDGQGIPEDILGRIYDPFFTTRRGQGGSGLGLYLSYNIVTKTLGGSIHCESTVGQGTRFTLKLPLNLSSVQ